MTALRDLGADAVAVTCGAGGVLLDDTWIPAAPAPAIIDATGAGDVFAGTVAAHLAHPTPLPDAVREGVVAAARSLGARGGTGWLTSVPRKRVKS